MASNGKSEAEARKDRLAAALRENLKRRKAQARAKGAAGARENKPAAAGGPKQAAKSSE